MMKAVVVFLLVWALVMGVAYWQFTETHKTFPREGFGGGGAVYSTIIVWQQGPPQVRKPAYNPIWDGFWGWVVGGISTYLWGCATGRNGCTNGQNGNLGGSGGGLGGGGGSSFCEPNCGISGSYARRATESSPGFVDRLLCLMRSDCKKQ